MDDDDWMAERFEVHRTHLTAVAYRMLGSRGEADDAVQESWLRLSRSDTTGIDNLGGWLTTVVARVCLNMLQRRRSRREEPLPTQLPETVPGVDATTDPEYETLLADSVGLALLVVLDTLTPAERLAFVLHDMFDLPFDDIAPIVGRTAAAARKLASRARRRVQGTATIPAVELRRQRELVDAFLAASRAGDFDALVAVLDPDVVLRADRTVVTSSASRQVRGAKAVAKGALAFSGRARFAQPALVNGAVGIVAAPRGQLFVVLGFVFEGGKIAEIDVIGDPARLRHLDLAVVDD
jgi:RNA polymerase sigma factor (sigma-70 family)